MCLHLLLCFPHETKAFPLINWVTLDKSVHLFSYCMSGTIIGAENTR